MLKTRDESIEGKVCAISGSGNAAQYTAEKLIELGAKVVTLSDSNGCIYDKAGIDADKMNYLMELKNVKRGRIKEYAEKFPGVEYTENARPWSIKCDCAFPCATQNELSGPDAEKLVANGCFLVAEGANMPVDDDGIEVLLENKVLFGPGKAANAGGVAVSGLEMAQNGQHLSWPREEVDGRLQQIMQSIHRVSWDNAEDYGMKGNLIVGSNIAAFVKTADAMLHQGLV
jgi:glutamate dehydrogenase (NADP+)